MCSQIQVDTITKHRICNLLVRNELRLVRESLPEVKDRGKGAE